MRNSLPIWFILFTSFRFTLAQADNTHIVYSPDHRFAAVWMDVERGKQQPAARLISVLDLTGPELLLTRLTTQRYTGAEWNNSSSRLALFDAPDNANTTLWIFSHAEHGWKKAEIDAIATVDQYLTQSELLKNPKGGINIIHWESANILVCQIQDGTKLFNLRVNTEKFPISTQVERLTNENGRP
jgi:hypothetical protein